jgi:hypothetical protein
LFTGQREQVPGPLLEPRHPDGDEHVAALGRAHCLPAGVDAINIFSITNPNGTVRFKNVNNCLKTNIYSYLETFGIQNSNLYLNGVHFFNTSLN